MTADRTDQLLDLLYGECSPDEARALRRAIDEDEALAKEWERLVADRDAVQQHLDPPCEMPEDIQASILDRAARKASTDDGAENDDASLPWTAMAAAAMALLAAGAAYYLVVHLGAPPQVAPLESPPRELAESTPAPEETPAPSQEIAAYDQEPDERVQQALLETSEEVIAGAQEQAEEAQEEFLAQRQDRAREADEYRARQATEPQRSPSPSPTPNQAPEEPALDVGETDDFAIGEIGMADDASFGRSGSPAELEDRPQARAPEPSEEPSDEQPQDELESIRKLIESDQIDEAREQLDALLDPDGIDDLDEDLRQEAEDLLRQLENSSP